MVASLSDVFADAVAGGIVHRLNLGLFRRRARHRAKPVHGEYVLRRGRIGGVLGPAVGGISLVIGFWVFAENGFRFSEDATQAVVICGVLLFMGSLFGVGSFAVGYRLTGEGIEHRILWWRKRPKWSEIQRIEPGFRPYEFVVKSDGRGSIVLSFLMVGAGTLAEELLVRIPSSKLAENPRTLADLIRIRESVSG